jgi:hypothetical protein
MTSRILVCGSGNTAHVLAGLLSADPAFEVRVFTRHAGKAARWREAVAEGDLVVTQGFNGHAREAARAGRVLVSDDPAIARGCDMIFTAVTAFVLGDYLAQLAPHVEDGAVLVGLPGQGGFEYEVDQHLAAKRIVVMNFDSAPWACRVLRFGRSVQICGAKTYLTGALRGDRTRARIPDPFGLIRRIVGKNTRVVESPSLLAITLMSVNAYSHPPIMYGAWRDWDGRTLAEPPDFYAGISRETAGLMTRMSDEVLAIRDRIVARFPREDLTAVIPMLTWDRLAYGAEIADASTQFSALRTNHAYQDMTHPMVRDAAGGWAPDFQSRFLSEDVPFGLVPIRGIAELAGVETPCIDEVLRWSQARLERTYLDGSRFTGADLGATSCPQRYGLDSLAAIL